MQRAKFWTFPLILVNFEPPAARGCVKNVFLDKIYMMIKMKKFIRQFHHLHKVIIYNHLQKFIK